MTKTVGIIAGAGFERLLPNESWLTTETVYGKVEFMETEIEGLKVIFIPRHGKESIQQPHKVNYRGNIWLMKSRGAEYIIAIDQAYSLRKILKPGMIIIPTDIIDFTKNREITFFEDKPVHIDFSEPFCGKLVKVLEKSSERVLKYFLSEAVIAVIEGPRLMTPAEAASLRMLGADIVNMTTMPEAALAKELNLCYATVTLITNYAAEIHTKQGLGYFEKIVDEKRQQMFQIVLEALKILREEG